MNEFQPLIDQIFRERIERARQMTPEERMDAGMALSQAAYGNDDPELRERIVRYRKIEEFKHYGPPQPRV